MVGTTKMQDVTFVRSSVNAGLNVLLYGPPGTGKTALVEAAFGDLYTVQGSIETEAADFVGSWVQQPDGTYLWVDGPLPKSMLEGKKLLVDEIALIDPRVMAVVYGVMDGRDELVVTANPSRGSIHPAPGFAVIGACNPDVPGAMMSDALLSRFYVQAEMKTDWSIATKLGVPPKITQVTRNLNEKAQRGEVTAAPQLRELIVFRNVSAQFGEELALSNYVSQIRPENREVALAAIEAVFGSKPKPLAL
jgi:MoxR-like ATPase